MKCDFCYKDKKYDSTLIIKIKDVEVEIKICPKCRKKVKVAKLYEKAIEVKLRQLLVEK